MSYYIVVEEDNIVHALKAELEQAKQTALNVFEACKRFDDYSNVEFSWAEEWFSDFNPKVYSLYWSGEYEQAKLVQERRLESGLFVFQTVREVKVIRTDYRYSDIFIVPMELEEVL